MYKKHIHNNNIYSVNILISVGSNDSLNIITGATYMHTIAILSYINLFIGWTGTIYLVYLIHSSEVMPCEVMPT